MPLRAWQLSHNNDANEQFFNFMASFTIPHQVGFALVHICHFLAPCSFYRIPIGRGNQNGIFINHDLSRNVLGWVELDFWIYDTTNNIAVNTVFYK